MSSVVLIDSDAALNAHLVKELQRHGLRVQAFADATEVMARKEGVPDLVVLCIDPKRTGWAVSNRLRKSNLLKAVPLIITSAEATEKDFEDHKKLKTRAEDYLHKPFGVEALVEKVAALIGLPQEAEEELEMPADAEEISVDDGLVVEDDSAPNAIDPFGAPGDVDSEDRTRIGVMNIDNDVNLETSAAFDEIGADPAIDLPAHGAAGGAAEEAFALPDSPFEAARGTSSSSLSEELDLGLEQVAQQASKEPPRPRFASSVHQTIPEADAGLVAELRREKERLQRELDELKGRPAPKAEGGGFSREREFLNLREIINKKEKEILDLRDTVDSKDRLVLDGKDKLRELERRARDLDEKALGTERELMAANEKIEALTQDKERVVEREKQVKARLEDALKSVQRYEQELDTAKKRHQAALEERNQAHEERLARELEAKAGEHTAEMEALAQQHLDEKQRLEADHEAAVATLDERRQEELRVAAQGQVAALDRQKRELGEKHEGELKQLKETHSDLKAGMQQRHSQELDELKKEHDETIAEFQQALVERDAIITAGQARVAELEGAVAAGEERESDLKAEVLGIQARLAASAAEVADRDRTLAERAARISQLEQESAGYQDQILKAYQRIKNDESLVARAKKALAIALTLLDESADGSDEASS